MKKNNLMKNFIFDSSVKELHLYPVTKEDFVTFREIELISEGIITSDVIFLEERMKDGSTSKHPLPLGSFNFVNEKKILLNHDISDCKSTYIIPNRISDRKYKIYYETLNDFLDNTIKEKEVVKKSYETEKKRWIDSVASLFKLIETDYLVGLPASSEITNVLRAEQLLGSYEIQQLNIKINNGKQIKFVPLAAYIIGGYGRIDIEFPSGSWGSAMLILNKDESDNFYWTMVEKSGRNVYEQPVRSDFSKGKFIKLIKDALSSKA